MTVYIRGSQTAAHQLLVATCYLLVVAPTFSFFSLCIISWVFFFNFIQFVLIIYPKMSFNNKLLSEQECCVQTIVSRALCIKACCSSQLCQNFGLLLKRIKKFSSPLLYRVSLQQLFFSFNLV